MLQWMRCPGARGSPRRGAAPQNIPSPMTRGHLHEIRFNYTSADDGQVVLLLLGAEGWAAVERLRGRRVTGRSGGS